MTDEQRIDQIYRFMQAYPFNPVKEAFLLLNRERLQVKQDNVARWKERLGSFGWTKFTGNKEDIPKGYEWTKIYETFFIRPPLTPEQRQAEYAEVFKQRAEFMKNNQELLEQSRAERKRRNVIKGGPKRDLSMKPTDKICITCGGTLAWEPICPGCQLGRAGFDGRYVCMEDMDHEFYVLREGIILPNQGD